MKRYQYFFTVLFLCLYGWGFSQTMINKLKSSEYQLIYQLTDQQAYQLFTKKTSKVFQKFDYSQPIDTCGQQDFWQSDLIGHFIGVYIREENVHYEYYQNKPFAIHHLNNYEHFLLKIETQNGENIDNAIVKIDDQIIPFDEKLLLYKKENAQRGVLKITYQGQTYFSQLRKDKKRLHIGYDFLKKLVQPTFSKPKKNYGYLALNKPKYRHGDTLKAVGYLVRKNKEYQDSLTVFLWKGHQRVSELGVVVPDSLGFYTFQLVLNDSLVLDQKYNLSFEKGGKKWIKVMKDFHLTDYELQQSFYKIRHKANYYQNDSVIFFLEGKDINGLPLLGTKAQISVNLLVPHEIQANGNLPFNLWNTTVQLDEFGQAEVKFPPVIHAHLTYEIIAGFETDFHERIYKKSKFQVNTLKRNPNKGIGIARKGQQIIALDTTVFDILICAYDDLGNEVMHKNEKLPYQIQPSLRICRYQFIHENDTLFFTDDQSNVAYHAFRTADSLFFKLDNPRSLPIHITLYENKKVIKDEMSSHINWNLKANFEKNYSFVLNYVWKGKVEQKKITVPYNPNELILDIDVPKKAIPGEKIDLYVDVKNQHFRPVKNTKLVSNGINKKLQVRQNPSKSILLENEYEGKGQLSYDHRKNKLYLNPNNLYTEIDQVGELFGIDTIKYYQWRVAQQEELYEQYDLNAYNIPQFSPFIIKDNRYQSIYAIWVDEQPVYFHHIFSPTQFSFEADTGKHTIALRTQKQLITIKDVELKNYHKLLLFLNLNHQNASERIEVKKMPKYLSKEEVENVFSYCLPIADLGLSYRDMQSLFVYQNNTSYDTTSYHVYSKLDWIGPFVDGDTIHIYQKNSYDYLKNIDSSFVFHKIDIHKNIKKVRFWLTSSLNESSQDLLTPIIKGSTIDTIADIKFRRNDFFQKENQGALLITTNDDQFVAFELTNENDSTSYIKGSENLIFNLNKGIYQVKAYHKDNYLFQQTVEIKEGYLAYVFLEKGIETQVYDLDTTFSKKDLKSLLRYPIHFRKNTTFLSRYNNHQSKAQLYPSSFSTKTNTPFLKCVMKGIDNLRGVKDLYYSIPKYRQFGDYAEQSLNSIHQEENAREPYIRSNFKDYTHLNCGVTNQYGQYQFTYSLPDNITTWDSYVLAMNDQGQQGFKKYEIKVYQPFMAQLSVPQFMLRGDNVNTIAKILNFTGNEYRIGSIFSDPNLETHVHSLVDKSFLEKHLIFANKDVFKVVYHITKDEQIIDRVEKEIPIYPIGIKEHYGGFRNLTQDTVFYQSADTVSQKIYLADDLIGTIIQEIESINESPYFCNEQIASKIRILLSQKELFKVQEKAFDKEKLINELVKKLERNQHFDGSWGWFEKSKSNYFITGYVAQTLQILQERGYEIEGLEKAKEFLQDEFMDVQHDTLTPNFNLYNLWTLSTLEINHSISEAVIDSSVYDSILLLKIQQNRGDSLDVTSIINQSDTTYFGSLYWGDYKGGLLDNAIQLNIWMYHLLKKVGGYDYLCKKIVNYFLEKRQATWRNTLESAQIIEILLKENLVKKESSQVLINDQLVNLPYEATIQVHDTLKIEKKGRGEVFFTNYETYWNHHPKPIDSLLKIQTHFETKNGIFIDSLKTGEIIYLVANIDLPKAGNYWMLTIPIPSTCTYYGKPIASGDETHREYFKNQVNIFYEVLENGNYQVKIPLKVRFEGKVSLNPLKMEMMYFPTFFGCTQINTVFSDSK